MTLSGQNDERPRHPFRTCFETDDKRLIHETASRKIIVSLTSANHYATP